MNHPDYKYGGARSMVELHDRHLREFLATWRLANAAQVKLPETSDPNYASRETLLIHVLTCAAGYLTWMSEQMDVPGPDLDENPEPAGFAPRAEAYMERVLAAWHGPQLRGLVDKQAWRPPHEARWGTPVTLDSMLEHAVMHPIRHTHQLERLMEAQR